MLVVTFVVAIHLHAAAGAQASLCKASEYAYLNAEMVHRVNDPAQERTTGGVILSVCSEQTREPIQRLTVRYGKPGEVLLERRATHARRMKIHLARTGPSMAMQVIAWTVGSRTYCITEGVGLEHGVAFYRVEGDVITEYGESSDYEHGPVDIDFYRRSSPVFMKQRPACNL